LIAIARSRPGQLNYISGGDGGISHIASEVFKAMAGVDIVRVRYQSDAVSVADLLTGQVEMTFAATNVLPHIKAGRLKALAVTSDRPSPLFPGVPGMAASLPGYSVLATNAMFAPLRTPATVVHRLNQEAVRFLSLPATNELFRNGGLEATGSTPEQLSALMSAEMNTVGKVIRNTGIRLE
jgi:tripartite-type tricarboxylate transporter receptor subunit TctC